MILSPEVIKKGDREQKMAKIENSQKFSRPFKKGRAEFFLQPDRWDDPEKNGFFGKNQCIKKSAAT